MQLGADASLEESSAGNASHRGVSALFRGAYEARYPHTGDVGQPQDKHGEVDDHTGKGIRREGK